LGLLTALVGLMVVRSSVPGRANSPNSKYDLLPEPAPRGHTSQPAHQPRPAHVAPPDRDADFLARLALARQYAAMPDISGQAAHAFHELLAIAPAPRRAALNQDSLKLAETALSAGKFDEARRAFLDAFAAIPAK